MRSLIVLVPLALTACGSASATASGGDASRSFPVGSFDSVHAAGSDTVHIVRGPNTSVVASGPAEVIDQLDVAVSGRALNLSRKSRTWFGWSTHGATITVTMPTIRSAQLSGSGDVDVDLIDGGGFEGRVAGSGRLKLASIVSSAARLDITGSGGINAGGKTEKVALSVGGSGNIDAKGLESQTADVAIRGSGDVTATARRSAALSISGSGNATVYGTDTCTISKSGSGEARCHK